MGLAPTFRFDLFGSGYAGLGYTAELLNAAVAVVARVPAAALGPGRAMPDLIEYGQLRASVARATELASRPKLDAAEAEQVRSELKQAFAINPRDPEALRLAAGFYERFGDHKTSAALLSVLAETAPRDGELFAAIGHRRFLAKDLEGAEQALMRARALHTGGALEAEELARIRVGRKDGRGALPFLEESLRANPAQRELWLLRAEIARELDDWSREADSIERALALASDLGLRTGLIRLYLTRALPDRALPHVRAVTSALPGERDVISTYAAFLEELKQPAEALDVWKRALEADPRFEPAHFRVTRLLIDRNALPEALSAAEAGLAAVPASARLHVAKSQILGQQEDFYAARRTLREAPPETRKDAVLMARLAELEDVSGRAAAPAYRAVAELVSGEQGQAALLARALDRGLQTALRDGDSEQAEWFTRRQGTANAVKMARDNASGVWIPGGMEALAFIAQCKAKPLASRFLTDYARTVLEHTDTDKKNAALYAESVKEHFKRLAALAALGVRKDNRVQLTLDVRDKNRRRTAEQILSLLGWRLRQTKNEWTLELAVKGDKAKRQETASALAVDELSIQDAFQAGKPFTFEIKDDWVRTAPEESVWRAQFFAKENLPGGMAEALVVDPRLARLYVGLNSVDARTSAALVASLGLKALAEKHANALHQHSSALAIEGGRATAPGGDAADSIWQRLAGATPRQPAAFFRALLSKDEGNFLGYFASLSQLDAAHQKFFTRNPARTEKFYELYREMPEARAATAAFARNNSFIEFLREVPLDTGGSVDFPGSPEVWMVAKGANASAGHSAKLLKKLSKAAAPDVEDEILVRLARTRYKSEQVRRTEMDNFMAVVRIDAHRREPLEEESALLLAQNFAEHGDAYPYFAVLTGLGRRHFELFFALGAKLRQQNPLEANLSLGHLHPLLAILCLRQEGGLPEAEAAEWFKKSCERMLAASNHAELTKASLEIARGLAAPGAGESAGDALRNRLLGTPPAAPVEVAGRPVDSVALRHARYRKVLELQKATPLETLLAIHDAAGRIAAGKGSPAADLKLLESQAGGLLTVEVPKTARNAGKQRKPLEAFHSKKFQETIAQLRRQTAKKKVNPKDLEKLAADLMAELAPQVPIALGGVVYACFLAPEDPLVLEDPLFLRKHQYFELTSGGVKLPVFQSPDLKVNSDTLGSYVAGGMAGFGTVAGKIAALSAKLGGEHGDVFASAQMAALRVTNWGALRDEDLRLANLKVLAAREWIARAAQEPAWRARLAESTMGLLSLTRRADLLSALGAGDWSAAWEAVTVSDLYFLGDAHLRTYKDGAWDSPAATALRRAAASNNGARLQSLGGNQHALYDCSHPHLRPAAPYEEYEKYLFPAKLGERAAEWKLHLALYADQTGLRASALGAVAEPAARLLLRHLNVTGARDWRGALAGISRIDHKLLEEALEEK